MSSVYPHRSTWKFPSKELNLFNLLKVWILLIDFRIALAYSFLRFFTFLCPYHIPYHIWVCCCNFVSKSNVCKNVSSWNSFLFSPSVIVYLRDTLLSVLSIVERTQHVALFHKAPWNTLYWSPQLTKREWWVDGYN